ncbi:MAG: YggN family protein [Rhizobium sp.]|nr:YggN family protein [Rhizobium sp.]
MSRLPLLLVPLLALAGCGGSPEPPAESGKTGMAAVSEKAMGELREELANENLSLHDGDGTAPKAEISPAGDLIIDGQPVPLDAAQRKLVLDYRAQLAGVAEAGAEVGLQAAGLATRALAETAKGLVSGDTASIEERMKDQAKDIEGTAKQLCDRLPALYASQQALRQAVPQFEPYAQMDETDVEDCHVEQ